MNLTAALTDSGDVALSWLAIWEPAVAFAYSAIAPILTFCDTAWPNMYWNLAYTVFVFWMYLFHAPFRVHSKTRTDWYAQLTKIMQAWLFISLTLFHLAPLYLEKQFKGTRNPGVVFFPLYAFSVAGFLVVHRQKRSWSLKVTYASTATVLLLNSLLVSLFLTVHYAYCEHQEPQRFLNATAIAVRWMESVAWMPTWGPPMTESALHLSVSASSTFWSAVCPSESFDAAPLATVCLLFCFGVLFVVSDYLYKRLRGFDEVRGILWCDAVTHTVTAGPAASPGKPTGDALHGSPTRHISLTKKPLANRDSDGGEFLSDQGARTRRQRPLDKKRPTDGFSDLLEDETWVDCDTRLQPHNPPAMVPWYSTLMAHTAFQLFVGSNLNFLSFDFRGLERSLLPKIFRVVPVTRPVAPSSATNAKSQGEGTTSPTTDNDEEADDLWFDWTADVGDGFNSTYEIARLLAQPSVKVHTNSATGVWGRLPFPQLGTLNPSKRLSAAVQTVRQRGRTIKRTLRESFSSMVLDQAERKVAADDDAGDDQDPSPHTKGSAPLKGGVALRRSASAEHVRSHQNRDSSSLRGKLASGGHTTEERRGMHGGSFAAPAGAQSLVSSPVMTGSPGSTSLRLPRGSFLLIGGDLAYPNPTEETYDQRLFGVYKDALGPFPPLRRQMHEQRHLFIQPSAADADMATIRVMTHDLALQHKREQASTQGADLHSTPLLFAIPGNHDWIDGLATFRNYIIGKSWLGGWYLPQRSSYFVLALPANWWLLCFDTGVSEDIDTEQLAYFMQVIESKMNSESCVVMINHEPGWIYDAYRQVSEESKRRLCKVSRKLGPRLRMRLCGDVHNYSRHIPLEPTSEAPQLVVSGGGGAFLHGPRKTPIVHMNTTRYTRKCAFPAHQTVVTIFTRLFGFRIVNWQFDFLGGLLYFAIIFSALPIPLYNASTGEPLVGATHDPIDFITAVGALTVSILQYIVLESHVSLAVCVAVCVVMVGIIEEKMPLYKRVPFGLWWAGLHITAATSLIALLHCVMSYAHSSGMVDSGEGRWASRMESQVRGAMFDLLNATAVCAADAEWPATATFVKDQLADVVASDTTVVGAVIGFLLRSFDVVEGLTYLARTVVGAKMGIFQPSATRFDLLLYYAHASWFYWVLATPVVSFVVGAFLLVSVSITDTAYDAAYSAFQIEDFKHFLRFHLNKSTRVLHVYVVGVDRVPKVWARNDKKTDEDAALNRRANCDATKQALPPPHLRKHPSVWKPSDSLWRVPGEGGYAGPRLVEEFVVRPHKA